VIAQEVQKLIPHAVEEIGDVQLNSGETIQNLLVVNERILLFENIGATQELKQLLDQENRTVGQLGERINTLEIGEFPLNRFEAWNIYCSIF
jgi:hypothetical protein